MEYINYKISDIALVSAGQGAPQGEHMYSENGIPFVKAGNMENLSIDNNLLKYCQKVSQSTVSKCKLRLYPKNSILFAKSGMSCMKGYIILLQEPAYVVSHLAIVIPNENICMPKYLKFFYEYNRPQKLIKDAAYPSISLSDIQNESIRIPSISNQKNIIEILDNINAVIDADKRQLELYDELIKSRFIEMFGDPNLNDKGWNKGIINDIGKCVAGATPSTAKPEYWENGTIPWMSSGEVNKGRIYETDTKITQLGYDSTSTKLVPPHTVVLAMAGQGKTRGTAAITEIELCTNQSICSIVNNKKTNPEYLLFFLKMQYEELRNSSNGAEGRGGLNLKIIGNHPVLIPPIELQNEFAKFVEQIDKSKFIVQKHLDLMNELLEKKMEEYFGGK